jgi:hypothetical protein
MLTVGCEEKARLMQERGVVELRKPEIPLPCNSESERVQFPIYRQYVKGQGSNQWRMLTHKLSKPVLERAFININLGRHLLSLHQ